MMSNKPCSCSVDTSQTLAGLHLLYLPGHFTGFDKKPNRTKHLMIFVDTEI